MFSVSMYYNITEGVENESKGDLKDFFSYFKNYYAWSYISLSLSVSLSLSLSVSVSLCFCLSVSVSLYLSLNI